MCRKPIASILPEVRLTPIGNRIVLANMVGIVIVQICFLIEAGGCCPDPALGGSILEFDFLLGMRSYKLGQGNGYSVTDMSSHFCLIFAV